MVSKKQSLPRHTILAKQGARTGAFLIDLAIFLAITLGFFFGCFSFVIGPKLKPLQTELDNEQIYSGLRFRNEDGDITQYDGNASFEEFRDTLEYYYLHYLPNQNIKEGFKGSRNFEEKIKLDDGSEVTKQEYYTVEWFNKNVLLISEDPDKEGDTGLFTYVKVDGNYDKNQIGIPKEPAIAPLSDISKHMQMAFVESYLYNFMELDYIVELSNKVNFYLTLEFVLSLIVSSVITYIVLPIALKNGQTLGKKIYKLGLATSEGYKFKNSQLFMRLIPVLVTSLALLIPIWTSLYLILLVVLIIFLVSFALSMSSPKKRSLHDLTANTIVIDLKASTIFENEIEEENYLAKEDGLSEETLIVDENEGEEPEISYEK